ncbi:Wzz/FepE/Etk N-terminal domain-containing protein [Mycobacterium sp. NPDC051804]|uniref:Wzz/FepE/Etk N-terminal domain-containing protein n=1 Tax=Mycobacterium sp. NPDC051804 TaxID=3364295 RepID=UPI0037A955CF
MGRFARRWWVVGLGLVLGLAAGFLVGDMQPKSYTATTTLFLGSPASVDSAGAYNGDLFSQQRAETYVSLVGNRDLAVKVIDDLRLELTPEELSTEVVASQVPKTVLLNISVTDRSPQRAAEIANAYATAFTQYVARLETPAGAPVPSSTLSVVQQAEQPDSPAGVDLWLYGAIGLVVGLLLGFLAKWALQRADRTIRSPEQLGDAAEAPVLGVLPRDKKRSATRLDIDLHASSKYLEAVRRLRTNLLYVDVDNPPKSIAFVSPTSSTSTTATATNLAVALDGIARQVAVVDADLRKPRLASYLGQQSEGGLASVLASSASVDDELMQISGTGIDVMVAGQSTKAASELVASDAMEKALADLRNTHDFVFVDTPGLLATVDAAVTGSACDGVILVAAQGKTAVSSMKETADAMRQTGAKILGVVLTEAR